MLFKEITKPSIDTCEVSSFSALESGSALKNRPWSGQTASHDESRKMYYHHVFFRLLIQFTLMNWSELTWNKLLKESQGVTHARTHVLPEWRESANRCF